MKYEKYLECDELVEGVSYICKRYDGTIVSLIYHEDAFHDYYWRDTHATKQLGWGDVRYALCTEESFSEYINL